MSTRSSRPSRGAGLLEQLPPPPPYVSRAGLKLAGALDAFEVPVAGRVVLDAGAATGGFTDCCLQRGARLVYAVDVAYGALAWRLRQDPRVLVLERTNLRHLTALDGPAPDLATLDLSFISLRAVWPAVSRLLARPADVVALVKPQFEAPRGTVEPGGVIRDPDRAAAIAGSVAAWIAGAGEGATVRGPVPATPRGRQGNLEFCIVAHLAGPG